MKIKDIVEGQIWNGVKQIGKGLGNVAGGVGMGALRTLDKIGGGKGEVGTAAQQAAYKAAQKAKTMAGVREQIPQEALAQFQTELGKMGIDLNDARTFNPEQVEKMLEQFATNFFSSGQADAVGNYILHHSNSIPMPTVINQKSALSYLARMEQLKQDAMGIVQQTGKGTAPLLHTASTTPIRGISLINDYPAIVNYNNKNYSLNDNGQWEDDKGVVPKNQWQMFLYKQADLLIPGSQELNKAFDKYTQANDAGSTAAQSTTAAPEEEPSAETPAASKATKAPLQVKVKGELITKNEEDGRWYDENGDYIDNPEDIKRLEREAEAQKYTRSSSIPKSQMPPVTWKTQKAAEREAARKARPGQLGADDETV